MTNSNLNHSFIKLLIAHWVDLIDIIVNLYPMPISLQRMVLNLAYGYIFMSIYLIKELIISQENVQQ